MKDSRKDYHIQEKRQSQYDIDDIKGLLQLRNELHKKKSRKSLTESIRQYASELTKEKGYGSKTSLLDWFKNNKKNISEIYDEEIKHSTQAFKTLQIKDLERLFNKLPTSKKHFK